MLDICSQQVNLKSIHSKNFKRVCHFHLGFTDEEIGYMSVTTKNHALSFDTVDNQITLRRPGDQNGKVLV